MRQIIGPLALVVCLFGVDAVSAQEVVPEFHVDVMSIRPASGTDYTQVDLYTRIPYNRLTFLRSPEGFVADYVVTVDALLRDGDRLTTTPVQTRIWEGSARADAFLITQSEEASSYTTQSLQLQPGSYHLAFQIEDKNSSQVFIREREVEVRDLSGAPSLSDLAILSTYDEASLEFTPRVTNHVGTDEIAIEVFYESYADQSQASRLRHEVVRLSRDGEVEALPEPEGSEEVSGLSNPRVYEADQVVTLERGRNQHVVTIPLSGIEVGPHLLRVRLEDQDGVLIQQSTKTFMARWSGLERHIADFDEAIDQLEYIAKKRDISFIREGATEADRYRRFRDFWDKRDPTPGTQRNEQMEEYYYRMAFANQRYSSIVEGWRTDRGFVLVRFGEPDFIRKKPHSFDYEPYEVWIYERIGRQFIFIDKTGFGDYELLVPIWDERTRLY